MPTDFQSFLTSLGIVADQPRRRRPTALPTAAQRRAAEDTSVRHLPGPCLRLATASHITITRGREFVPSVTKDTTAYEWHPDGQVRIRPGIPRDLGLVGKPLGDRKIAAYMKEGKYGPEYKQQRKERQQKRTATKPKTRNTELDRWLADLLS